MKKRILSLLLCGAMLFSLCPQSVLAEGSTQDSGQITAAGGLCEHHPEHDADCGYTEGSEGTPCGHEHSEDCYTEVTECVHEHSEDCYPEEAGDSVSGNDATPSDAEEREPENCPHICDENSGCVTKELNCQHEHKVNGGEADREGGLGRDDECGYVPATEGTPCEYVCEICTGETGEQTETDCICTALCMTEAVKEDCPVCGAEDADLALCEGEEPAAPSNAEIVTVASVQAMIDDLPNADEITEENAEEVKAQLEAIDEAKAQLSDEEIDELDFSRYIEVAAALEQLLYGTATPSNALMLLADYDGSAIVMGADGISGYADAGGYHYIYFGYWTAPDSYTKSAPIKWRVLDTKTNMDGATEGDGFFLLSDVAFGTGTLGDVYFDSSGNSNEWQGSDAQAWCKDFAGEAGAANNVTDAFTAGELGAVLATTKSDGTFTSSTKGIWFSASDNILNGDKVFFLSAEEAENAAYGFPNDAARVVNYGTSRWNGWWLRSPIPNYTDDAGMVQGGNSYVYFARVNNSYTARPAFNLDLNAVLFTSAADNSGHISFGTTIPDYSGSEWKVTLKDGNDFSSGASMVSATTSFKADATLTINHAALSSLSNEYTDVTAALTDASGKLRYYGSINSDTSATESTVTIPAGLSDATYTLSIYGEDRNEAYRTDYATGTPYTVTITVDNTPPGLSAYVEGSVSRTSDTEATVKFTSHEAGTYYYTVVDKGENAPDIDTTRAGTACDTTEQTISLTTLTAGAKDIYIVVKDAAGNVSDALSLEIPAYVVPTMYTLTVELNGGSGSTTGGEYAEGAVINVDAGTRSGYRFSGWTSSNGGSFADASSASTTFTMPAANTTITASWRSVNTDAGVTAVSVDGVAGTINGTTITAQLPHNATLPTDSSKISITVPDGAAKTTPTTNDNGATWTFTVTAEDGSTKETYTINVSVDSTHTYGDWQSNEQTHWKECACGDKTDVAAHSASDWITDTAATETTDGTKHKECTVCGYVLETGTIPATGTGHTHSYGESWKSDADNHWHECSCGDKTDVAAHSAGDWITDTAATETTDGTKHKECTVCGYVLETETIPATGTGHTHSYGESWKSDADNHWHECSCGAKADEAVHAYDDEQDTTCNVCGYVRTVAPTSHRITVQTEGGGTASASATSATAGTTINLTATANSGYHFKEWQVISGGVTISGNRFTMPDENVTVKAIFEQDSTAHDYTMKHNKTEHWDECGCGDVQNREAHRYGKWTVTKEATKTESGEKERTCTVCGYTEKVVIEKLPAAETKPDTSTGTNKTNSNAQSAYTGDSSNIALWFSLMLVAGAALAGTAVYVYKKKHSR